MVPRPLWPVCCTAAPAAAGPRRRVLAACSLACSSPSHRAPRPTPPHPCSLSARFFEDYKKNENKLVVVDEFLGKEAALRIIREAMDQYQDLYVPKRQRH